jgi:hypothetical protein
MSNLLLSCRDGYLRRCNGAGLPRKMPARLWQAGIFHDNYQMSRILLLISFAAV